MPDGDSRPARLPGGAPRELRSFVACTVDRVELDLGDMGWIPEPEGMGALPDPSVEVADGWTPTSATITVGYGFVRLSLPASIVDGQLQIDTSNLDIAGVGPAIDRWVDAFNRTLQQNGKRIASFDVRSDRVAVTKSAIAADEPGTAVPAAAAAASVEDVPADEPAPPRKATGCLAWILAGIAAIAAAVGITLAVTGDDADAPDTSSTDAVSAPSSTTSAPTTSTTVAEVGQAPPSTIDLDEAIRTCGSPPPGWSSPPGYPLLDDGDRTCEPGPGSYTNEACDPVFLPCSDGTNLFFVATGGQPGVDHSQSVPDAVTGQEGNSKAEFAMYVDFFGGPDEIIEVARITSDCAGDIVTGESPIVEGEVDVVDQPLLSFGPCTVVDATVGEPAPDAASRRLVEYLDLAYEIGPAEPDPELPNIDRYVVADDRSVIGADWAGGSRTVLNSLGAERIDDDCFWMFEPDRVELISRVLDGASCPSPDRYWVLAAGLTDVEVEIRVEDLIVGHGAGHVNPLGAPIAPISDTTAFATSDALFDDTLFPCGYGDVGYTACPDTDAAVDAGGFVAVSAATVGPIPIDDGGDRRHVVDFAPSGGPSYSIAQTDDGWRVASTGDSTRARAILRHNSLTLVVPDDELPEGPLSYQWSTTTGFDPLVQPVTPVVGLITTPVISDDERPTRIDEPATVDEPTTDAPLETIEDFYAALSSSIAAGDLDFSLDRLHPTVVDAYPDTCPAALESFADPDFAIRLIAEGDSGPWTWDLPDGRSFDIPDATTVTIALTGRGQTGDPVESHLAIVDDRYRWFTFC